MKTKTPKRENASWLAGVLRDVVLRDVVLRDVVLRDVVLRDVLALRGAPTCVARTDLLRRELGHFRRGR